MCGSPSSPWNSSAPAGYIFIYIDDWVFFGKYSYVEKIQVSLEPDKNNWHFTRKSMYVYCSLSLNSSYSEKCLSQKL